MTTSRHYEVLTAIKNTLESSTVLCEHIRDWKIQKRYWNRFRFADYRSSGFIAPLRRQTAPFENIKVKWTLPCLIGVMIPSDGSVSFLRDDDSLILISEYLEDMFAYQGKTRIPPLIAAVGQANADPDKFYYEKCSVEPADQYLEVAIQNGFDAIGMVVNIEIQFNKKDFSTLGA